MALRFGPGAWQITSVVLSVVMCVSLRAADVARATLIQVLALPSADRVSLVMEWTDPLAHVSLTPGADKTTAIIEAGPVGTVQSQELVSGPDLKLIASVTVRRDQQSSDGYVRVLVRLRTTCHQRVRVAGRRIYLDLVPLETPAVSHTASSGESVTPEDPTDKAYRALEADGLRRARILATQANVKALETLRGEVVRRDAQLGHKRAELVSHLIDEIDRYTHEARALRLKLDALLFRKQPSG